MTNDERIKNLKGFLAKEKADPQGSKRYIADLEASIERLERQDERQRDFSILNNTVDKSEKGWC